MKLIDLVEFHSFIPRALPSTNIVVDLGANYGRFSHKMLEKYGSICTAVEASPDVFQELQKSDQIRSFNLAILDYIGVAEIHISSNNLGSSAIENNNNNNILRTVSVPCMGLESFLQQEGLERIDLLKVDIEGAEILMLQACSDEFLKNIPQITIEFHDFNGINSRAEVEECLQRLKFLGFDSVRFSRVGHQDTLLINRDLVVLSNAEFLYVKYIYRNFKGFVRILRKVFYGKRWSKGYS